MTHARGKPSSKETTSQLARQCAQASCTERKPPERVILLRWLASGTTDRGKAAASSYGWIGGNVLGKEGTAPPGPEFAGSAFLGLTRAARSRLIERKLSPGVT